MTIVKPILSSPLLVAHATQNWLTVAPDVSIRAALTTLEKAGARVVLVATGRLQNGADLLGILTARDLVRLVAQDQPLDTTAVAAVMSHPVITIQATESTQVRDALRLFQQHQIQHLPVLDACDRILGVITPQTVTALLTEISDPETGTEAVENQPAPEAGDGQTLLSANPELQPEQILQALVHGTAAVTGEAFFPALVQNLATALGCAYATVTELKAEILCTRAFWSQQIQPNFCYSLADTPCELTLQDGIYYQPAQLQQTFPLDTDLVSLNAESYLGIALINSTGKPIGLISVLDVQPMQGMESLLPILQIFAARAAAELEREQTTESLEQLNQELERRVEERTAALYTSQQRYESLAAAAPVAIFRFDTPLNCVYVNERWSQMSGRPKESAMGRGWTEALHPEDRARLLAEYAETYEQPVFPKPMPSEGRHLRPDGSINWYYVQVAPEMDPAGNITSYIGTLTDITDRKEAEFALEESKRFIQKIADTAPNILYVYDVKRQQNIYINRRVVHILGYSPEALIAMGANFFPLMLHPDAQPGVLASFHQRLAAAKDGEVIESEMCLRHANGGWRWLSCRDTVFSRDANGDVIEIIGVAQDITDRKGYAEGLERANAELIRATRLKDEFLANMSHELRTPLNSILGMSEMLLEEMLGTINPKQRKAILMVESSGEHLLELINDVLEVSKMAAEKLELDITTVAIADLCEASLAFIQPQARHKQIQLRAMLPEGLGTLEMDERRMRQVLINLLTNAVKFTPDGGEITLEVKWEGEVGQLGEAANPAGNSGAHRQEPSDTEAWLTFAVTDTGIGIAEADQALLFQPFVQIDSSLSRRYEGTGLGLVLVKQIVELHGGTVTLTSQLGEGSCFTVRLPRHHQNSGPIPPQAAKDERADDSMEIRADDSMEIRMKPESQISVRSDESVEKQPLILLAEDNPDNRDVLSSYLDISGYPFILAANGEEAIALTHTHQPNLIFMDIQMPGVDGLEAIRRIRQDAAVAQIPIIALTALAMKQDRDSCLEAGASDYLAKPIKLRVFLETIQRYLS